MRHRLWAPSAHIASDLGEGSHDAEVKPNHRSDGICVYGCRFTHIHGWLWLILIINVGKYINISETWMLWVIHYSAVRWLYIFFLYVDLHHTYPKDLRCYIWRCLMIRDFPHCTWTSLRNKDWMATNIYISYMIRDPSWFMVRQWFISSVIHHDIPKTS